MQPRPLLVTIPKAATVLGCGKTKFLELLKAEHFETVMIGRRRMVVLASLETYVAQLRAEAGLPIAA